MASLRPKVLYNNELYFPKFQRAKIVSLLLEIIKFSQQENENLIFIAMALSDTYRSKRGILT